MGVLVIFPIAAMMAVWCKRRFEIMIFPTIVLIVVTMAVTGLVGILRIGLYVPVIYAVVALGLLISRRKKIKKYILTPGFAAFCIYIVFFLFFSKGRYLASEASCMQYGPSLMSLFTYDSLKDHSLYYNLTNPFPLGTLWVYFCGRLLGGYSESAAIFAYDVLVIAGIMPLFCQIRTIKEENWQWLAMLAIGLSLPLLKLFDAYRSFDMVVPQATAMIYTYFIFSRMIHQGEKKGDRIFAACGILFSVILTQYSMLMLLPLLAGCCAVAFSNVKKYKGLFAAMLGGLVPAIFLYVYNLIRQEILVKDLLLLPGHIQQVLVLGFRKQTFLQRFLLPPEGFLLDRYFLLKLLVPHLRHNLRILRLIDLKYFSAVRALDLVHGVSSFLSVQFFVCPPRTFPVMILNGGGEHMYGYPAFRLPSIHAYMIPYSALKKKEGT